MQSLKIEREKGGEGKTQINLYIHLFVIILNYLLIRYESCDILFASTDWLTAI